MKVYSMLSTAILALTSFVSCSSNDDNVKELPPLPDNNTVVNQQPVPGSTDKIAVYYVTSWSNHEVNPAYMTHINYAFGHVNELYNGVRIDNEEWLKSIVLLKKKASHLKVLLSIGGWGSGRFSEMAASDDNRKAFAADCKRIIDIFGLDGIDIDWEFPTSSSAGISSSPDDTRNYTLMMRDIRQAIGSDKLLTLATVHDGSYIDFHGILPYIDFVNIMTYDMGNPPYLHSALYDSPNTNGKTTEAGVRAHLAAGVPPSMLVVGMPFYGRGKGPFHSFADYGKMKSLPEGFSEKWDDKALVPYITDAEGKLVLGFENARSLKIKCDYVIDNGFRGAMYWEYSSDDDNNTLRSVVADNILGKADKKHVLVLSEGGGQHGAFTRAAMQWLIEQGKKKNFAVNEIRRADAISERFLADYDLVIQLDFPPYTWPEYSEAAFIRYIEEGGGAWIGFHHATLLGEFDGYPLWQWFSNFMGGITFKNYVAQLADGTVMVEDTKHPVMKGVSRKFVLPDDEWYTYNRSPRGNVRVLASVDEDSYTPTSDVKMGDHPVIWTNEAVKAKNVYFQFGHSPRLLENKWFKRLFTNAIEWSLDSKQTK
ncbi:MAG: glycosyl hydrolase family 18 protein [bacterium]|nr:glycosyl hydrolase family 18 protein [bacterium]